MRSRLSLVLDVLAFIVPVLEMAVLAAVVALLVITAASSPAPSPSPSSARPGEVWTLHR